MIAFTQQERETLFEFVEGISNNIHNTGNRSDYILTAVGKLMLESGYSDLLSYLNAVSINNAALEKFINQTTIHTTRWFREEKHFALFEQQIEKEIQNTKNTGGKILFKVASIGCSTGQEAYSLALVLEQYRSPTLNFEYEVSGYDIDGNSIATAQGAIYPLSDLKSIPERYHNRLLEGHAKTQGLISLDKAIRSRCHFIKTNVFDNLQTFRQNQFDCVFVRNLLIYVKPESAEGLLKQVNLSLKREGRLFVGHCETALVSKASFCKLINGSVFKKNDTHSSPQTKRKVLIIEDNQNVQRVLKNLLTAAGLSVDSVSSEEGLNIYLRSQPKPQIISLDLHMPNFIGAKWLRKFRNTDKVTPVVIVSSLFAKDASPVLDMLSWGAQEYIEKSDLNRIPAEIADRFKSLIRPDIVTPNSALYTGLTPKQKTVSNSSLADLTERPLAILIGASTGGIQALRNTLSDLPANTPPVVIVQHIATSYSVDLCNLLAKVTRLKPGETKSLTPLKNGHFYLATDDYHLTLRTTSNGVCVLPQKFPNSQFRPSVDALFTSVDEKLAKSIVAILLTGMGTDGVKGMGKLRSHGAKTIAQNQRSSAVFGMPGKAIKQGFASYISEPQLIREYLRRVASYSI